MCQPLIFSDSLCLCVSYGTIRALLLLLLKCRRPKYCGALPFRCCAENKIELRRYRCSKYGNRRERYRNATQELKSAYRRAAPYALNICCATLRCAVVSWFEQFLVRSANIVISTNQRSSVQLKSNSTTVVVPPPRYHTVHNLVLSVL